MDYKSLTGAVLSGGNSSRMGRDKGLIHFNGLPMAKKIALEMAPLTDAVFINANHNLPEYQELNIDVVTDDERHHGKGPLSGVFTCLQYASSSHLLISPCDTPNISEAAFFALLDASISRPKQIHHLIDGENAHPLHAILPVKSALTALDIFLEKQQRHSVMAFYETFGCNTVTWDNSTALLNLNTPDCLKIK